MKIAKGLQNIWICKDITKDCHQNIICRIDDKDVIKMQKGLVMIPI